MRWHLDSAKGLVVVREVQKASSVNRKRAVCEIQIFKGEGRDIQANEVHRRRG